MGRYEYRTVFSHCPLLEDDFERLACEIKELVDATKVFLEKYEVSNVEPIFHKANPWTLVKLLFLKMYIRDVYTPIIGRNYPAMAYIDLFAGSGLDQLKIKEKYDVKFFGSAMIAATFASYPFTKLILNDLDPRRKGITKILEQRVRAVAGDSVIVFNDDANVVVQDVKGILKALKDEYNGVHYLAFLDPNGLELKWRTINELISLENEGIAGDFVVLFQGYQAARNVGRVRKKKQEQRMMDKKTLSLMDTLNDFFCSGEWLKIGETCVHGLPNALLDLYMSCFERTKKNALIEKIPIELIQNKFYWLIYVTRKTSRGSPYIESVRWLKKFVEGNDPQVVKSAVLRALGFAMGIDIFMKRMDDHSLQLH